MYKKIISIFTLILMFSSFVPSSASAQSEYPTFRTPTQYEEVLSTKSYTITWYAPESGTATKYLISLRKLKNKNVVEDELLFSNVEITSRSYTLAANYLQRNCYYRVAVGAVLSSGKTRWIQQHFYTASGSIENGNTISFKVSPDLELAEKNAIYYSTQAWRNALGVELANVYSFSNTPSTEIIDPSDGENIIVPYLHEAADAPLMRTYVRYNSLSGYIVESDIGINEKYNWSVGSTANAYDVQNVMTHEMGHVLGVTDKYETFSAEWTMYGSSSMGEIKKRSLETADIAAAKKINRLS